MNPNVSGGMNRLVGQDRSPSDAALTLPATSRIESC